MGEGRDFAASADAAAGSIFECVFPDRVSEYVSAGGWGFRWLDALVLRGGIGGRELSFR
jgi:hypothetical protein